MLRGLAIALGAACAAALVCCTGSAESTPRPSATSSPGNVVLRPPAEAGTPTVLDVVCRSDGSTVLLTSSMAAQPDGIHFLVTNERTQPVRLGVDTAASRAVRPGSRRELIFPLAPSTWRVHCITGREWPQVSRGYPVRVENRDEAWTSDSLDCGESYSSAFGLTFRPRGQSPLRVAHEVVRSMPPDTTFRRVGWRVAVEPQVGVVLFGRTIAIVRLTPDRGHRWYVSASKCFGSGVAFR